MADKKIKLDFDPIINYFKNLSQDMIIAYSGIALGIILIIIGLVVM